MDAAQLPEPTSVPPVRVPEEDLTPRERDLLDFERQWWKSAGAKEQAIRERFDLTPTRYYQLINRLLDKHEAMQLEPHLVNRLRRLRGTRERARAARRAS
ncbi:hypothetical protein BLA60_19640 [Actinophytocola xinjiangensis]|jgi:hypothetical protein|uniref:DUF3263 domain-containing protein n=1 Tax=Actinophytocola xinjiangensis TaxID=485602 RepID=A0A7Z0WNU8_9PSEU|nr:DUF3263 domain-containing protein [Actinophytocola xinjiangensis]OLF09387.1 hypothetical protein BLA60_19640 [Actinophytocola xinjiangensis]